MRKKQYLKKMTEQEHAKALQWGLSKFINRLLQLTEANYRKVKRFIEELLEEDKK